MQACMKDARKGACFIWPWGDDLMQDRGQLSHDTVLCPLLPSRARKWGKMGEHNQVHRRRSSGAPQKLLRGPGVKQLSSRTPRQEERGTATKRGTEAGQSMVLRVAAASYLIGCVAAATVTAAAAGSCSEAGRGDEGCVGGSEVVGNWSVHIAPVNGTTVIGAEVMLGHALNPAALPANVLARVKLQLTQTPVLIFRGLGQRLSMIDHVQFARQFGTVDPAVSGGPPCESDNLPLAAAPQLCYLNYCYRRVVLHVRSWNL
jgi:hypothetical protein